MDSKQRRGSEHSEYLGLLLFFMEVFQKDVEKLRRTAYDAARFNVDAFMQNYCGASKLTAEGEAVLTEDKDLLRAVLAVKNDDKAARAQREPVLLSEVVGSGMTCTACTACK